MKKYLLAATVALSLLASASHAATCTTAICKTDGTLTVNSGGTLTIESGGTLTAASGSTVALAGSQTFTSTLTRTMAPTADSATTNKGIVTNLTSPVDTTGTNTHNAFDVGLTIGNASGGTNSVRGLNIGNVTGDAQVNVTGINVGTGTTLGTSRGVVIGSGWDAALDTSVSAGADSGQTNMGIDLNLTTPVDTTGTNTHYGLNIDTVIGNASGGTNTATAINIANVSGDAQVTENGIVVGTGFDSGLTVNSPATFNGDVTGDGGDQMVGFLNNQVAATATTITAAQCGSTFISGGAVEMELPEASTVLGCRLTFVVNNASNFTIDPDAGDTIALLTNAAGDSLIADAVGESIVIEAISASQWAPIGAQQGTWTDSN